MSKFPQKITQLQCHQTNLQLKSMFLTSISSSFKYLPNLLASIYDQIQLLAGLLQYRLTVAISQPQPGDKLQNLSLYYQKITKTQKILWLILSVVLPYLWKKGNQYIGKYCSQQISQKIYKFIDRIEKIQSFLQFINLALFYRYGEYRTLIQRILKMKVKFIDKESARILNFSLMNRRLLWQIYQMFLQNILPFGHKLFSSSLKNIFYLNSYMEVQNDRNCIICGNNQPTMPVTAQPCNHVGCYYCIQNEKKVQGQKSFCKLCNTQVQKWIYNFNQ